LEVNADINEDGRMWKYSCEIDFKNDIGFQIKEDEINGTYGA
jgi:hypothetical protein